MQPVVIIGAGVSGLSAACHLSRRGYEVTVVERSNHAGGVSGQIHDEGFTFDTGPTVLTMRELIAGTLAAAGSDIDDLLPMHLVDPAYRARFADGSTIHVRAGRPAMRAEIEQACGPQDAAAFDGYADWLERLYAIEMPHFIGRNFNSPLDLLASPVAALRLLRMGGFGRLGNKVRRTFTDPRLHRLFSFQALYAGLDPNTALALYAVITYMDSIEGVWACDGGMHAMPAALATAAGAAGVHFLYGAEVTSILTRTDGNGVAGIELADGEKIRADAVVCTVDQNEAYRLLPDLRPPRALLRGTYSPSAVVWHVGARGGPAKGTTHHNIHFGEDWDEAFTALTRTGTLMPDPSRLVSVPSLGDPTLAPDGSSTMYVLEPVPNLDADLDWTREAGPMRERLYKFLDAEGYPTDIVAETLVTPADWQRDGLARGTPFALAHTFGQTGPFRPPNRIRKVPGLVFAGMGTVPGVGVPMVLISGRLAAERVAEHLPTRSR